MTILIYNPDDWEYRGGRREVSVDDAVEIVARPSPYTDTRGVVECLQEEVDELRRFIGELVNVLHANGTGPLNQDQLIDLLGTRFRVKE